MPAVFIIFGAFHLRQFINNINFLFIDECSSPTSYFDDDFQDVDIKEEPLESFDVSYAVIFFFSIFIFLNILIEVNLNIARSFQFSG